MLVPMSRITTVLMLVGLCAYCADPSDSQEPPPVRADLAQPLPPAADVPKEVEVLARGPIHEAFASPSTEPKQSAGVPKRPPTPMEEMPPEEKPEGQVVWIGGYWSWDDDRADFLWVSGCWRVKPTDKEWVPGYWREVGNLWQWVGGFWTSVRDGKTEQVTYYPEPPAPPNVAPAGPAPEADQFYVPGYWMWNGERYAWRAGYWNRVRPGYVYVASHYRWTPMGYVFVPGYWDLAVAQRGVLYAPIVVDTVVVGPRYVYTPYYAIRGGVVLDTLFVRPNLGFYYFGDYYGPRYAAVGFEPCVVYSRRHYEPIIVYERWVYRDNPRWLDVQMTLVADRHAGRVALPPRTLALQVRAGAVGVSVVAPARTVVAAGGGRTVVLSAATRNEVRRATVVAHERLVVERHRTEVVRVTAPLTKPHAASLNVTISHPVAHPHVGPPSHTGPVHGKTDHKKKEERKK